MTKQRARLGIKLFAAFFGLGAAICLLTVVMLLFPGSNLDSLWRLNPDAHVAFQRLGRLSILLMLVVGAACASAVFGLATQARWGIPLALGILIVNVVSDSLNAFVRHDLRTLIGLPIGAAMIAYLLSVRRRVLNQDPKNYCE
jgi:hypothetical protein